MPGTRDGGFKAERTIKERHGDDFFKKIGAMGGRKSKNGGFASEKVGPDGLTGVERSKVAGAKGGRSSKRGPAKPKPEEDVNYLNSFIHCKNCDRLIRISDALFHKCGRCAS